MDPKKVEKINALARSMKELHLASSMEEAMERAKEILLGSDEQEDKSIKSLFKEMKTEDKHAKKESEELHKLKEELKKEQDAIADIEKDGNKKITIKPGEYYLVKTMETINCPSEPIAYDENSPPGYIIPDIRPRVSLQKAGVSLDCSTTNPGYRGPLWPPNRRG